MFWFRRASDDDAAGTHSKGRDLLCEAPVADCGVHISFLESTMREIDLALFSANISKKEVQEFEKLKHSVGGEL